MLRLRPLACSGVESGEPDATSGARRAAPDVRSDVTEQGDPSSGAFEPNFCEMGQRDPKRPAWTIVPKEDTRVVHVFIGVNPL
jgi:hypothetical protein